MTEVRIEPTELYHISFEPPCYWRRSCSAQKVSRQVHMYLNIPSYLPYLYDLNFEACTHSICLLEFEGNDVNSFDSDAYILTGVSHGYHTQTQWPFIDNLYKGK